jgi:hypothetical protein
VSNILVSAGEQRIGLVAPRSATWEKEYLRRTAMSDFVIAAVCSTAAIQIRFGGRLGLHYAMLCVALPRLWLATWVLF